MPSQPHPLLTWHFGRTRLFDTVVGCALSIQAGGARVGRLVPSERVRTPCPPRLAPMGQHRRSAPRAERRRVRVSIRCACRHGAHTSQALNPNSDQQ
jgi:hypothetical protein